MPPSIPNTSGSDAPAAVPYGDWQTFPTEPYKTPWGDRKSVVFNSADGRILAGSLWAAGKGTWTWPYDQLFYVTQGTIKWQIEGGESFTLTAGGVTYLRAGTTASYEMSEDYANVVVFISDDKKVVID